MKEYTTLHILHDWWSKIMKEKERRDKLYIVGTTSKSLDHLWANACACDPIQLLQCGLHTRCPICFVKLLKIWFNFHHVRVQIKHEIIPLLIGDIICTCSPNTCTIPLKNWQLAQRNISDHMVSRCWRIHVIGMWEIHAWEVCNVFTRKCLHNTPLNPYLVANHIS
jgi:hypothetical protein